MTRFISEALGSRQIFGQTLNELEAATDHSSIDIKFTLDLFKKTKAKIAELGLDPEDTTPRELFHALQQKVRQTDETIVKKLRTLAATHVSAIADPFDGMVIALNSLNRSNRCYAIKPAKLKS